ncbi:MAG: ParB/RepB/Spo0J family partition protein [Syntrophomonadaceae bacterium]|nr:ParB/RepB/Spo0J family partition protein [Syntrophomonadaceae bacterium]
MAKPERGLGRGLDALFASTTNYDQEMVSEVSISDIVPRKEQPRKNFDPESLRELSDSIREHGVLQPLLVRTKNKKYEIIAGERRWRAAQQAGLKTLPVLIKDIDDEEAAEFSLIENIQRDDLTVLEEAQAYRNMIDNFSYTQEKLASRVGKSRAHIANTIRILKLPAEILDYIEQGKISAGHARAILGLSTEQEQIRAGRDIIAGNMTVREIEKTVKNKKSKTTKKKAVKTVEISEIENLLEKHLATRIKIITSGNGGKIEISYYNGDDLERLVELLGIDL